MPNATGFLANKTEYCDRCNVFENICDPPQTGPDTRWLDPVLICIDDELFPVMSEGEKLARWYEKIAFRPNLPHVSDRSFAQRLFHPSFYLI